MTAISINTLFKKGNDLDRLATAIGKMKEPKGKGEYKEDTRFWRPKTDKAGNGYAVIRFLPAAALDGEAGMPWISYFDHGFKGPNGKWYFENSLTTFNKDDPASQLNSLLWKTEDKDYQDIARSQKRRLHYISNIYVVKDPGSPENEGKVFLFKYGKQIFDKVEEAMFPPFPDKPKLNPFDFKEGMNFKLKIRRLGGFANYALSEFENPAPLAPDNDTLEKIWNQEYSVLDFLAQDKFKPYDTLKKNLDEVLGCDSQSDEVFGIYTKSPKTISKSEIRTSAPTLEHRDMVESAIDSGSSQDESDELSMEYFENLAKNG